MEYFGVYECFVLNKLGLLLCIMNIRGKYCKCYFGEV